MLIYNLTQIIKNAAKKHPNTLAFKYLDESITFAELNRKSSQLANYLINSGINKGDRVGIYMHRCLETTIAIYGALKSGAVYVPLDPFHPTSRTQYVIEDCGIQHLLATPKQTKKIVKLAKNTVLKSIVGIENPLTIASISWENLFSTTLDNYRPINILSDDIAYILYTSGSTGTPKGIMHTHNSALAFAKLSANEHDVKKGDILGMHAPLYFDPSCFGFFAFPLSFATTVIVSDPHTKMPLSLARLIEKEKITIWYSVPLALIQMLKQGALEECDMSSLRWVLFSGEVFATKHLKALMKLWSFARFSNIYGPTETNQCTYYHLDTPPENDDPIPIGYVWGDTEFKIIDDSDYEVENGLAGELVVRTSTMMKGYWNNPELTQKSLFIDTIIQGVKQVYYRTGDQVRQDKKGRLLFLGRNDRQIKIRGFRVEIDEIENVLTTHSDIEEAAVIIKDIDNEKELIASILLSKDAKVDTSDLEKFCKQFLPSYALPKEIKILKEFPRTSSGKINRKEIEKKLM